MDPHMNPLYVCAYNHAPNTILALWLRNMVTLGAEKLTVEAILNTSGPYATQVVLMTQLGNIDINILT